MTYSFPYVFILILLGICAFLFEYTENEEKKSNINAIAISVFVLFFGFRGYIYTDWIVYTDMFRDVEWNDLLKFDIFDENLREPGFTLFCLIVKTLTGDYIFFNVASTVIYLLLLIRFCRQFGVQNTPFVLMLFLAMDGTVIILNLIRNSISIGIWLNALIYLRDKKPLPYFALCLVALTFHLSSILFFPLYFVLNTKTNKWVFLGAFLFFFVFFLSKQSIILSIVQLFGFEGALGVKAEAYTELYVVPRGLNPSGTLEKLIMVSLVFIYYDEIAKRFNGGGHIILNMLLLYFLGYYFFGEFKTLSDRMSTLFITARWMVWLELLNVLIIEGNKRLLAGILFTYCLYMTALNLNQPIMEYDNVILGAKNEAQRRQIYYKIVQYDE